LNDMGRIDPMYQFSLDRSPGLRLARVRPQPSGVRLGGRGSRQVRPPTPRVPGCPPHWHQLPGGDLPGIPGAGPALGQHSPWKERVGWRRRVWESVERPPPGAASPAWGGEGHFPPPHVPPLPAGEWENSCNQMQRMLVVRSLRPDRVAFCVTAFIVSNLGSQFVEPPVLNMKSVSGAPAKTPLIFVLSPGVDPSSSLLQLAEQSGMAQRFHALSLGQGQAAAAEDLLPHSNWVFLANCHLSLSWMPQLDKVVEQLQVEEPHPSFRLWLSSSPHPDFPISILQAGIKMTTEPPTGLKANMKRLYQLITEPQFSRCTKPAKYKKLLFALCFFHSILLERKKFLQLGWNIVYGFNDSDFEVSENLLSLYLDEYEETPWEALTYLIAGVNYGGHVTDDWDRRLLTTYINDYFNEQSITSAPGPFGRPGADGNLASYKEYISLLPSMDAPEAFGQHPNADVASQITEARTLFETLLSLQPQTTPAGEAGQSREDKGLVVMSTDLEEIFNSGEAAFLAKGERRGPGAAHIAISRASCLDFLPRGLVGTHHLCLPLPPQAYPSQKPLAAWTRDLGLRVEQFAHWAKTTHPPVLFWLSGFTFPTGFLTAVLQAAARLNNVCTPPPGQREPREQDGLSGEPGAARGSERGLGPPPHRPCRGGGRSPRPGACAPGLMPALCPPGTYACPCYYYPNRAGTSGRPSFVIGVDLRSGAMPADHWIKRGTALLMSLDT
uniref:Dynein axonemal heavy chain 2 n=1 Tax=Varanus komodoensis TaxID=61221 RepID=A0A8D2LY48_VARKO